MSRLPPVTIIVLNWNGRHLLAGCLSALLALDYPDATVLLVDNASGDGSIPFVRAHFPAVQLQQNERNLGYAGGNNRAIRATATPVVALVNPDVVVAPDWLRQLVVPFADPQVGIVGSRLYYPGSRRLQHAGGAVHFPRALPEHFGNGSADREAFAIERDVPYVIGAATALRRAMLDEIGLFDEGYFLYYEDVDLCTRARRAGFRVVYRPQATGIHDESALAGKGSAPYLRHFHSSRWRYLLKHAPAQTLLEETIPAEAEWVATVASPPVAVRVYQRTLARFDAVLQVRERHGAAPLPAEVARELVSALRALRQAAWAPPYWERLQDAARLQEQPFRSSIPLAGRLIAAVRAAWSRVAVRPYVRPLLRRQTDFNNTVLRHLQPRQPQLDRHDRRSEDVSITLAQTRAGLRTLLASLAAVDDRLARLEQGAGPGADEEE